LSSCTTHASSLRTRQRQAKDMNPDSKPGFRRSYKDAGRRIKGFFNPMSPQSSSSANPQSTQSVPMAPQVTPPLDPSPINLPSVSASSVRTLPIVGTQIAPPIDLSPPLPVVTAISEDGTNASYAPSIQLLPVINVKSHSRVNIPLSLNPPPSTASVFRTAKEVGSVAWAGLGTALRVMKESSEVFPPLKSAVSGLLACLDVFQVKPGIRSFDGLINPISI
jgi:hypothetical protein